MGFVADLQREGPALRWLRSFAFVDEETYVWMITATDVDQVARVRRVEVGSDHIAEVYTGEPGNPW